MVIEIGERTGYSDWRICDFSNINVVINFGNIAFTHTSDVAYLALLILMDMGLSQELRDQNRCMSDPLDISFIALGVKDMKGRYQRANPEFLRCFGV